MYDLYAGDNQLLRAVHAGLPSKSTAVLELTRRFVARMFTESGVTEVRVRCGKLEISADRLRLRLLEDSGPVRSMEIAEHDLQALRKWATG